jgi:methionyl aminopeptidase
MTQRAFWPPRSMGARVAPGVTTAELDAVGKEILDRYGAQSAPQLAYGFPRTTCISVNDRLAHASRHRKWCCAPVRNIGRAVERRAKRCGFQVIRNLCGHGVGRFIHEDPQVPNTFNRHDRTVLREGLVITIEPFLTTGATLAVEDIDGWTLRSPDGSRGAQFEHTLIIARGRPIVVT